MVSSQSTQWESAGVSTVHRLRKGRSLQEMGLAKLDMHLEENGIGPSHHTLHAGNSRWTEVLSVRPETIKLLDELWGKFHNIGLGPDFLGMTLKTKIDKWDWIRAAKGTVSEKAPRGKELKSSEGFPCARCGSMHSSHEAKTVVRG